MSFLIVQKVERCKGCVHLDHGMEGDTCRKMSLDQWFSGGPNFHVNHSIHEACPLNVKQGEGGK